jgi:3-deoxy-manno-octulosonate cytidylyltransferase (CMP-KDO synthetase)
MKLQYIHVVFDDVFVVTDSDLIFDEIVSNGGKAIRVSKNTSRGVIEPEAVSNLDVEIVVNVQGDEPLLIQSL